MPLSAMWPHSLVLFPAEFASPPAAGQLADHDNIPVANKRRTCYAPLVALKTCSVSCNDLQDVLHTVEVTAETLYDAVAKALLVFRQNDWVADIGTGMTPVTVVVKEPTVMHQVLMRDFERWLKRNGRSTAETANRSALRKQLGV
jgi:hypothetical protein